MRFFDKNASNHLKVTDFLLRLFVIPFSIAALWLTVTNRQDDSNYGSLDFSNIMGLKYMVCINAIAAGYACLAAVSLWIKCLMSKVWVFFVSDQVMAYLMVTSMGTVIEILYLAYNGNSRVTWSEACSTYARFCGRLKLALTLHVVALFCFFLLAIISAYRLFTRFDPPFISSNKDTEGEEK